MRVLGRLLDPAKGKGRAREEMAFAVKDSPFALVRKRLNSCCLRLTWEQRESLVRSLADGHAFKTERLWAENLLSHGVCKLLGLSTGYTI